MKARQTILVAATTFLFLALTLPRLNAQILLIDSPGSGFTTAYTGSYNLGYQITTGNTGLLVSALGFYDIGNNGLIDAHQVGLWDTSGTLLASVNILSGNHSLINGFAFEPLVTPVLLLPNASYVLGAYWPSPADQVYANFLAGTSPVFSGADLAGARFTGIGTIQSSSFSFPLLSSSSGTSRIGPNLSFSFPTTTPVPESSTYGIWVALTTLCIVILRVRKKAG